jgi:CheY-like chemotaxis protein
MGKSVLDHKKILAVDDEPDVLAVLKEQIEAGCTGCTIDTATTYDEAAKRLGSQKYDLVVLDIVGVRGFDLLGIAVKDDVKAVMLTAHSLDPESLKRAHDMGARAYLPKEKLGEIVPFLEDALKFEFEPGWRRMLDALRETFVDLWGRDWEKWEKDVGAKFPRGGGVQ